MDRFQTWASPPKADVGLQARKRSPSTSARVESGYWPSTLSLCPEGSSRGIPRRGVSGFRSLQRRRGARRHRCRAKHRSTLFDVKKPGLVAGLALLESVRDAFPAVPVLITSGHSEPEAALRRGAAHFLRKPYEVRALLALVDRVVGRLDN